MKKQIKFLATAAASLALAQTSHAATVSWNGGGATDDWNDTANWGGVTPGATTADNVIFTGAGDSNAPTADFTFVTAGTDLTARNSALITIQTGVTISNFKDWRFGANASNDGGNLTMTGGALSGSTFQVASSPTATSRSILTVSGGSLTTSGDFSIGSLGDFNLSNNTATFTVGSFTASNGSIFNATFNASGISTIAASGALTIGGASSTAKLNFDLDSFLGTGTFDLVTFSSISGSYDIGNIMGLGALSGGRTATLGYDADSMFVTIAVPEPGTYALLAGLTGLVYVMVRRRRA